MQQLSMKTLKLEVKVLNRVLGKHLYNIRLVVHTFLVGLSDSYLKRMKYKDGVNIKDWKALQGAGYRIIDTSPYTTKQKRYAKRSKQLLALDKKIGLALNKLITIGGIYDRRCN